MKHILLGCFLVTGLSVFAQQQASFARNLEHARVDELRNNNKSKLLLFELKEGETVTESLFSQLAAVMEEKEGYVMMEAKEGKLYLTVGHSIEPADAEDVLNQFGTRFAFVNQVEHSLKVK